ncbi:hypothetical protein [Lutispora sp.]|uniref:hypothetical protein n=1 Tax=Lutispora sp. TaxID=2828727 RepID=UPI002B21A2E9|nr:hypothetical protein [Lutispora sp.]MEA4963803.1 hypothetical protein [Lutispora sp.]
MKKKLRFVSLLLVMALTMQLSVAPAFAAQSNVPDFTVISQDINKDLKSAKQIAKWNNSILYTSVTPEMSYCSQITPEGKIQFSYVRTNDGVVVVSEVYDVSEIYSRYNVEATYSIDSYDALNCVIIANIASFNDVTRLNRNVVGSTRGFSTLSSAITDAFGSNYTSKLKGSANKSYNGTTYYVRCTESQTTSNTTPDSHWFAKDTAITAVIAWALTGGWSWIGLVSSIVVGVVSTVIVNGVNSVANAFTADRSNVSLMHTRIVTVSGYSGTQYWAGWTRKMYFFKGNLGWTHDTGYNHNIKHTDFDNVSGLMEVDLKTLLIMSCSKVRLEI